MKHVGIIYIYMYFSQMAQEGGCFSYEHMELVFLFSVGSCAAIFLFTVGNCVSVFV